MSETTEIIVRVTIEDFTSPAGDAERYAIVISREDLAVKSGLPEADSTKAAERLARRRVIDRARYSDGRVYYIRRAG